jgi:hypothetical protein
MPCPNKRKGHDENSPGSPDTKRRILQKWSLSNQMNTPIRIKNFLLLQRFTNQHHRNPKKTEFILLRQSESKIFFFFSALPINIIAIPKKQNSFSLFFSSYSSSFASSPSSKRRGRSVHGHSKNSKIPKIWPNSQMGISGVPTCRQGAVPAPVGFDFTPRCSVDEKKKPGGRQKIMVRLLFDKAN